jgi:glutamate-1-semialdehyde 2,1-aminomutase
LNNDLLFAEAKKHIPGGVNSPVRAFNSVGGTPVFINSAKGAYLFDEVGKSYIDFINSWGPMILGHANETVVAEVQKQLQSSLSFGAPTSLETAVAKLIKQLCPNVDLVRMVNSGTEACMSALRVARGFTGKNKFIKFEGNYHGHADPFLVKAGSGVASLGIHNVAGVTKGSAEDTLVAPYNNLQAVQDLITKHKGEIAAIILEPVAGNMGCIPPQNNFLQGLRSICNHENIVLIFDEVMTGFRLAKGGAQEVFGVDADLICYGKIIGGGMPVGAYGGKQHLMESVAPVGKVYQAGTLSGNPIAMRAGLTTLSILSADDSVYQHINTVTKTLEAGLQFAFGQKSIPVQINRVGSMISIHFSEHPIVDFESAANANNELFKKYFHFCLQYGVYLPPSPFETWFVSNAITQTEIDKTLSVTQAFVASL